MNDPARPDDGEGDGSDSQDPGLNEQAPAAFPLEEAPTPLPTDTDMGTTRALSSLLTLTPFIDLHQRAGGDHPVRAFLCFWTDYILRMAVWLLFVGVILAVAWKVLAPLPALFDPR